MQDIFTAIGELRCCDNCKNVTKLVTDEVCWTMTNKNPVCNLCVEYSKWSNDNLTKRERWDNWFAVQKEE